MRDHNREIKKLVLEPLVVKLRCKIMTNRIEKSEDFNRNWAKFSGIWPKKTTDYNNSFDSVEEIPLNYLQFQINCDEKTERVCFVLLRMQIF